jgi:hypothetical protein
MASRPNQRTASRPGTLTPAWKNSVRIALATGATIATLFGVQALALGDQSSNATNGAAVQALDPNTDTGSGSVIFPDDQTAPQMTPTPSFTRRQRQSFVNPAPNQPIPSTRSSRRGVFGQ